MVKKREINVVLLDGDKKTVLYDRKRMKVSF